METPNVEPRSEAPEMGRIIEATELVYRMRWNRFMLSRAASNPYLERPAYAA